MLPIGTISFRGPRLKIKRAYKHIQELETWLNGIIQFNIDTTRAHKDYGPGRESHTVSIRHKPGFADEIPLIVGDAIHNLRASLDLFASAVVIAGGKDDPTRAYFPLYKTRENLVTSSEYGMIQRADPALAAIIADVITPQETTHQLLALNKLDRMDKHRLLVPTIAEHHHMIVSIREDQENNPPPAPPGAIFMLAGLSTVDRIISNPREPKPGTKAALHNQQNGYPTLRICFGKGEAFENEPIVPTLRELAELIARIIDALETYCLGKHGPRK